MPVTTLNEVNTLLQLSGYDNIINMLIPKVQYMILTKINSFAHPKVFNLSSGISFKKAEKKIFDSNEDFLENDFTGGIDILVSGFIA